MRPSSAGKRTHFATTSSRPSSAPRRPKYIDLRAQLRKKMSIVKNRRINPTLINKASTVASKWKVQKPIFELSRKKHRALKQGKLSLYIKSGRNLSAPAHDHSGLADPYSKVILKNTRSIVMSDTTYHNDIQTTNHSIRKTKVRYKTRDPRFDAHMEWRCTNMNIKSTIEFLIFDVDANGLEEAMGTATLNIGRLIFSVHGNNALEQALDQTSSSQSHAASQQKHQHALQLQHNQIKCGKLNIEFTFTPDFCPIAAKGRDMLDRAEREGLQLNSFHQLGIKGKRAIGQFYNIPCIDDPKLIVPFLRDIYQDIQERFPSNEDPEIADSEFKNLLAVIFHTKPSEIDALVRGMDYDASGFVAQDEATSFFLSRSEAAALSGADANAYHVCPNIARRVMTSHGSGGVHTIYSLSKSKEDNFGHSIFVGLQTGGARIYSEDLKKQITINTDSYCKDHDLDLIHPENVPSWEKIKQPHIHAAIDLPPQNIQQRHLSRKLFLACSDRKIRTLNIPKRMESLLVGKFFKDLRCGPTDLEVIQPTVPLCLELMDRGTTLSSLLWIGGSTGTVTVRDVNDLSNVVAKYEDAHVDGVTCIKRIHGHNLNTVITAGMGGRINLIDPTRIGRSNKIVTQWNGGSLETVFQMKNGVLALDWSNRRHSLYTGDYSQRVKIWDPFVKKSTGVLGSYGNTGHRHLLLNVVCNDSSNQIITTDVSGMIKVWDTRTLRCLQTTTDPEQKEGNVGMTASVSDDQGKLITGGATLHYWKMLGAKEERESKASRSGRSKRIKGKRSETETNDINHTTRLEVATAFLTRSEVATFASKNNTQTKNGNPIGDINLDASNNLLKVLKRQRGTVELTKNEKLEISKNVNEQIAERKLFCTCPSNTNVFVTITAEGYVTVCRFGLHSTASKKTKKTKNNNNKKKHRGVDTTGDGITDAIGYDINGDGAIDGYDVNGDGKIDFMKNGVKHLLRKSKSVSQSIHSSGSSPSRRQLSSRSLVDDDLLRSVTTAITSTFHVTVRHGHIVTSATLDHGGRSIFIGCSDGSCRQFNLETGWLINTFQKKKGEVSCLILLKLHSGWRLVGGGWDRTLTGWDVAGKQIMSYSNGHKGDVTCLCQIEEAFMVSGDSLGRICMWSTQSRYPMKSIVLFEKMKVDSEIAQVLTGGSVTNLKKNGIKTCNLPNVDELPMSIECMCYDSIRRMILIGTSSGIVIALNSTTLSRVKYGNGIITSFLQSSVDSICLNNDSSRLILMDAGKRLRLFDLEDHSRLDADERAEGRGVKLIKCWQPRNHAGSNSTNNTNTSDIRQSSIEDDRGMLSYSDMHRAFVTTSKIEDTYCMQMFCSMTGSAKHVLSWKNGDYNNGSSSSSSRKSIDLTFQEKKNETYVSIAPKQPVLSSIGEFALEIDRMRLLENKNVMIYEILNGGDDDVDKNDNDNDDNNDGTESNIDQLLEEKNEKIKEVNNRTDFHHQHVIRKHKMHEKLHAYHLQGLVSFQGDAAAQGVRVQKRKKRSEERSNINLRLMSATH